MDTDGNIWNLLQTLPERIFRGSTLFAANAGNGNGKSVLGLILLFIIFVICGGYFGGAESGFSAMNKIRIKAKAEDGDKRAKGAMYISNNFDRALTTLLIGNNITHIAAASIATVIATRLFGTSETVTVWCTIVTTLIIFLFSEMIPKSFANDRSETMALFSARTLRLLMKFFYPLVSFFTLISTGANKLMSRVMKAPVNAPSITEDELYDIIDTIEEEGVMNEEQGDLFKSALEFSGTRAEDVMTMRADICAVDASLPNREILNIVRETTHSRLPVYEGDLDHIIGTLQIRTFLREYLKDPDVDLRSLLLEPFRVSPTAMIDDLLTEMRQHRFYLAVVADEDARTLGIITIEDFLEELVGEIWDEDDVVDQNFMKLGGNRFRVNTHLTLGEVCERIGIPCADEKSAPRPILSLLLEHFGKIPEENDVMTFENLEITVDTVEDSRVITVIIRLILQEDVNAVSGAGEDLSGGEV